MPRQGIVMVSGARLAAPAFDLLDAVALDGLRETWGSFYDIGRAGGSYAAIWLFNDALLLTANTPEGLDSAIRADYARRVR